MEEKILELYYKYLKLKLDLIFDFECNNDISYSLNESRFQEEKHDENSYEAETENYGPHGDYTRYNLLKNGEKIDESSDEFRFLGEDLYCKGKYMCKNGKIVADLTRFDRIGCFDNGVSICSRDIFRDVAKYQIINTKGSLIRGDEFDYAENLGLGYTLVNKNGKYNVINKNGKYIFKTWSNKYKNIDVNHCFITLDDETYPLKREFLDYKVKRRVFGSGYICSNEYSSFSVEFIPLRIYDYRFSIGLFKEKVYLYDSISKSYKELGLAKNIEYSEKDPFIIDKINNKAFLIYENQFIDISKIYEEKLKSGTPFSLNPGIRGVLSFEDFVLKAHNDVDAIIKDELENIKKEREELEERKKEKAVEDEVKKQIEEEKELLLIEKRARQQLQESLAILQSVYERKKVKKKFSLENIFIEFPDHSEIRPELLPILKLIDFSGVSLNNVKLDNIDFRGTNISFNPQNVYNRNLRNSNFEGLHMNPWIDFTGVDIRGCKFSFDEDKRTIDFIVSSLEKAIYDETTTYNGIPLTIIFAKKEEFFQEGPKTR